MAGTPRRGSTRWTPQENEIVIMHVKQYPTNLNLAFNKAAEDLPNRSADAVMQRWHNYIKKDQPVMAIGAGENPLVINTKNNFVQPDGSLYNSDLRDAMLVTFLTSMSKEELIDFFMGQTAEEQKTVMFKQMNRNINRAIK
jgi:hypothetical protein